MCASIQHRIEDVQEESPLYAVGAQSFEADESGEIIAFSDCHLALPTKHLIEQASPVTEEVRRRWYRLFMLCINQTVSLDHGNAHEKRTQLEMEKHCPIKGDEVMGDLPELWSLGTLRQ